MEEDDDSASPSPSSSSSPSPCLATANSDDDSNQILRSWDLIRFRWSTFSSSWSTSNLTIPAASFLLVFLFTFVLFSFHSSWSDFSTFSGTSLEFTYSMLNKNSSNYPKREQYLLTCPSTNMHITCPANYPFTNLTTSNETCPEYFRWIHEDLKTWKKHGITKEMVENLEQTAHFRLVIVNGTAYVKQYNKAYQTRDVYTLWGILQLLKLYPGRLPDLDLMFQCHDKASIKRSRYSGMDADSAPPQFHYCKDDTTLDIVFPDWSFWGWPEVNVKPWVPLIKDLEAGNMMMNWTSRKPFAFWKGNLLTGARHKYAKCASIQRWNAEIVNQDWMKEYREGFKNSDLSKQCVHRYKIYLEGNAWSVSEKYIMGCDSMSLLVNPKYYDFFSRGLIPMKHYWPVNPDNPCKSIKFAVDWGNNNTAKAKEIGKAGTEYVFNQVKIEYVYDYMFHLLYEYGKLLRYRPTVPEGAVELCSERFACSPMGLETAYKVQTMVNGPVDRGPCSLPPPFERNDLQALRDRNSKTRKQVQMWEQERG